MQWAANRVSQQTCCISLHYANAAAGSLHAAKLLQGCQCHCAEFDAQPQDEAALDSSEQYGQCGLVNHVGSGYKTAYSADMAAW